MVSCAEKNNTEDSVIILETDSTITIIDKDSDSEVCSLFYDKEKVVVKTVDYYDFVEEEKSWLSSVNFYPNKKVKDSMFLSVNGLFYETKKFRNDGFYLEKSESILSNGKLNQYWYFDDKGGVLDGYGLNYELTKISSNEIGSNENFDFQISNGYDSNCEKIKAYDLYIGNYNTEFNLIDSSNFSAYLEMDFSDTISIKKSHKGKNQVRYWLHLSCAEYKSADIAATNVKIPISGAIEYFVK
jgi:hypothetical protein